MRSPSTYLRLRICVYLYVAIIIAATEVSVAEDNWGISLRDHSSVPEEVFRETRQRASAGLPDGLIETHDGMGDIASAWYGGPTTRYRHGVLGDAIEASSLLAQTTSGTDVSLILPESEVFEDRYPRLADLDGDGKVEIVTIRSSTTLGASVTLYGLDNGRLVEKASTGFIGQANRWLNIAGIARFRGLQGKEIAFIETPHLGGTLYIYAYLGGDLAPLDNMHGFSNHALGSMELRLSAVVDFNEDGRMELAVPSEDRSTLKLLGLANGELRELASVTLPARIDKAIAVKGSGRRARFIVGLENGHVYDVHR